jgi:hypothetical protein
MKKFSARWWSMVVFLSMIIAGFAVMATNQARRARLAYLERNSFTVCVVNFTDVKLSVSCADQTKNLNKEESVISTALEKQLVTIRNINKEIVFKQEIRQRKVGKVCQINIMRDPKTGEVKFIIDPSHGQQTIF